MQLSEHLSLSSQPARAIWTEVSDAIAAAERRHAVLQRMASARRAAGHSLRDQDFPEDVLILAPARPSLRPLVLIGGMGPLAGLEGFLSACRLFGDRRETVLYQACAIPDRTRTITTRGPAGERILADALAGAIVRGVGEVPSPGTTVDVLVLCNTAHAVFPTLQAALERDAPDTAVRVRLWSLVDGVAEACRQMGTMRPLVLSTRGSRAARLFTAPLSQAGCAVEELDEDLQTLLDGAVYQGVKTGDRAGAVAAGRHLPSLIRERHAQADAVIAGCTEIPLLLRWLAEDGGGSLPHPVLDPVLATLQANRAALAGPQESTVPARFFAVAEREGDRPALCTPSRSWTYAELAAEVRRLAAGLVRRLGPGNAPVAVLCDGRGETIPALLGVLTAGKIYVPVDASAPEARVRLILEDAGAEAVLAAPDHIALARRMAPADCPVLDPGQLPDPMAGSPPPDPLSGPVELPPLLPDSLAYLLYTSGSTGRPKGVAQDHRYILTLTDNYTRSAGITADDRLALLSSLAFSASVRDLYCAFLNGAALHAWDLPGQGLTGLSDWMEERRITLFFAVASLYRAFARTLAPARLPDLRMVQVGSESVYGSDLTLLKKHFGPSCRLMVNLGSTELSPVRQALLGHDDPAGDGAVPLDLAVPGNELLLLGADGRPVPPGDTGAIVVRGRALSPGYWRQSALTLEALRPDSLGRRRYVTGDVGRLLPDGRLQHLGRADQQIKIRGYRIDPNEVEAALRAVDGVRDGAVTVDTAGEGALYGYVVAADPAAPPSEQAIRRALLARLPEPMVPARLMLLESLPLGATGKINRKALPPPPPPRQRAAETPTERRMAALWEEILGGAVGADEPFLLIGGSSLAAARIAARLPVVFGVHLPIAAVFESPTIAALSARIDAGEGRRDGADTPLLPRRAGEPAVLSPPQRSFWLAEALDGPSATPVIARAWRIRGSLDIAALRRAAAALAARHEALRSVCGEHDGEPVMIPWSGGVSFTEEMVAPAALDERLRRAWNEPFDLRAAPPFRLHLFHTGGDGDVLLVGLHHIAGDDASTLVLARDLSELYAAEAAGRSAHLPTLPVQVGDLAAWLARRADAVRARWEGWWSEELRGVPADLALPFDRPRRRGGSYAPGAVPVSLDAAATTALKALARAQGATVFTALLTAFAVLIGRTADTADLVIGAPLSRRSPPEAEELIGCFVHTLPLRLRPAPDRDFTALLDETARTLLRAMEAGELPFDAIVAATAPERPAAGRIPLVQVMLTLVEGDRPQLELPGLDAAPLFLDKPTAGASVDLTLSIGETDGALAGRLEYDARLFDRATVAAMAGQLETLLRAVAADPACPVGRLALSPAEAEALRGWSEGPTTAYPRLPLHRQVEAWAARTPDAVAVTACAGDGSVADELTYAALTAAAARLASRLAAAGVVPGDRVALVMGRSAAGVTAALAILKAGAAYVPIDPGYPADRIAWMIADIRAAAIVSRPADAHAVPSGMGWIDAEGADAAERDAGSGTEDADGSPGEERSLDAPAYLMFTSGSTGRPKGVVVPQRGIARLVCGSNFLRLSPGDSILHQSNPAFDAATLEIWGALLNGARLVVGPPEMPAPDVLDRIIRDQGVRAAFFTTGLLNALIDERPDLLGALACVLTGGEAMSVPHAARLLARFPGLTLINGYGPTESTTFTLTHAVGPADLEGAGVPIGRPIANDRHLVLDGLGEPAAVNVPGELWIGGDGLALGYWNRPELTAERFVTRDGRRYYRSGDRVRRRADGAVLYLGRLDDQVKLRGFRVEPGEVEAALRALPGVRQAVAAVRDLPGGPALLAWVVPDREAPNADALRAALAARLPAYMLPAAIGLADVLPLNANGKVDLRALPTPAAAGADGEREPPLSPEEAAVASAFSTLLGRPAGRHDGFFALGGHSLLAVRLVSRLAEATGVHLPLRTVWEAPTVAGLAQRLRACDGSVAVPEIVPQANAAADTDGGTGGHRSVPLSAGQERLWFLHRLDPVAATYNMAYALRLDGDLDAAALDGAFRDLLTRHGVLRMGVSDETGEPLGFYHPAALFTLQRAALPDDPGCLRRCVTAEAERPFDLTRDPPLRAALLTLGPRSHALLLTMHHIVSDGWSMGILAAELTRLYAARRAGLPDPLPPPAVQYADYAIGQRRWLAGPDRDRHRAWWRGKLTGAPPLTALPTDRPRPAEQTTAGACLIRPLSPALAAALQTSAVQADATPFMVGLAAFALLLARWTGQQDLVIGIPVANRRTRRAEEVIGFFVNTLAVRLSLDGDPDAAALLARVRDTLLEAWQHQDLPLDLVVEAVAPERSLSHPPLFNVMFDLEEVATPFAFDGVTVTPLPRDHRLARFDLTLTLMRRPDGLDAACDYNRDLFDAATVERMAGHWETLLAGLAARSATPALALPMLPPEERAALLPAAAPAVPGPAMLHHLVALRAQDTPDAPAVVGEGESLTYAVLMERATALAGALQARGIGPGGRVLILMSRSPALIAALLGVMQAGGAWVPVDPSQPAERVARIAADAGPVLALSEEALAGLLPPDLPRLCLDTQWPAGEAPVRDPGVDPERLCYVIYTSGSTGEPRGVLIPHRAAAAFARGAAAAYGITASDRVLQFASIAFDAAVEEIFPCLWRGGRLVLRTDEMLRSPARFLERCGEQGITVADLPTSFWHDLVLEMERQDLPLPPALRLVIIGGEAARPDRLAQWRRLGAGARLLNTYGPTETTVVATFCDLTAWRAGDPDPGCAPIGRPLPGVRALVLDPRGEPVPPGVAGELHLGGTGLAHGYLGRPDATARVFVAAPWAAQGPTQGATQGNDGERLYRTGDRVRLRPDGEIEFLGRLDHQIKLRGFRVEPGEIEAALRRQPGITAAVVGLDDSTGRRRLVAHVVGGGAADIPALKAALRRTLPEYMVPEAVVAMDALPVNHQGKIDRRALPPPPTDTAIRGGSGTAGGASTPVEQAVAALWRSQLGDVAIGPDDNFFDLGGTSLTLIRVHALIQEQLCPGIPLVELFRHPSLRALAARLAGDPPATDPKDTAQSGPRQPDQARQDGRARLAARRRQGRPQEEAVT